jgi:aldehyde:ferredoxin oxidoreductase
MPGFICMKGWTGSFLKVNLTNSKTTIQKYDEHIAKNFLGGRGLAVKILWDNLKAGTEPLSPDNLLIFAGGPLTGIGLPNSGKLVIASKSPLTGGYGDGNSGSWVAVNMRKAGYDAIIIEGKASTPVILHIKDESCEFLDTKDLWGKNSFETEETLRKEFSRLAGIASIGTAGENLVRFATVVCQQGRSGGRPGMGAVMGSKNLKAIVVEGTQKIPVDNPEEMKKLAIEGYKKILTLPQYSFWKRQSTMSTVDWCQENSCLPTYNFKQGVFDKAESIDGFAMEKMKISNRGCPQCNMTCGNVVKDIEGKNSELDYENVVMLGSNIGLGNLKQVACLNRLADDYGFDSISLGGVIGFAMELSQKGLIPEKINWGDFEATKALIDDIAHRKNLGALLADGVRAASQTIGQGSNEYAMHVKGLEVSAYNCHTAPGMALAYGTSSIGAHHKDAWIIIWEIKTGRTSYDGAKVEYLIKTQIIRGGAFEAFTVCRFPYNSLGFDLEWYHKYLRASTGQYYSLKALNEVGNRILTLIRAFWIREYKDKWSRELDVPPMRWFKEPLSEGPLKGSKLDLEKYQNMLSTYYIQRGWDRNGVPKKSTMTKLDLEEEANQLNQLVKMEE